MNTQASESWTAGAVTRSPIATAPMQFDPTKYKQHLESFDLTEEQQTELLAILWHIMATFVDLGFGVDSVQMLLPALAEASAADAADQLDEGHSTED